MPSPEHPTAARSFSAPALALWVALGTAIGCAAGVFVALHLAPAAPERAQPTPATAPAGESPALLATLERLNTALERMPTAGSARAEASPGSPAAARDTAAPEPAPALAAATAALERAAETLARRLDELTEHGIGPGTAGVQMPAQEPDGLALSDLVGRSEQELGLEHAFWRAQRVIHTYGRPSRVSGLGLHYELALGGGRWANFTFHLHATGYVSHLSVLLRE
jgi:hypothetical protein